jgi:hypothetical protein
MYSETILGYDIMRNSCTPTDWMSGSVPVRTLWPVVHQVQWMGHRAWIRGNDFLKVHSPRAILRIWGTMQ